MMEAREEVARNWVQAAPLWGGADLLWCFKHFPGSRITLFDQ